MNKITHLGNLLEARRAAILEDWTRRVGREHRDKELSRGELRDHLPGFLDEIIAALSAAENSGSNESVSNGSPASVAHGIQRLRVGFDLTEVIREYAILTECILDAVESVGGSVSTRVFKRVLATLDTGRAQAVSAYIERRDKEMSQAHSQHVGFVAHELRGPLANALFCVAALQRSGGPEDQRAFGMLIRSLSTLRELIDEVLTADRLTAPIQLRRESLDFRALLEQTVTDSQLAAQQRTVAVKVHAPDVLRYSGDHRLLSSAIGNVLGNAIKFSHVGSEIDVRVEHRAGGITIEIEDACGGLPDGNTTELFEPFVQRSDNRTGFGLGLAIVKQAIEAHNGTVSVRNLPGKGCVFSLELPELQGTDTEE